MKLRSGVTIMAHDGKPPLSSDSSNRDPDGGIRSHHSVVIIGLLRVFSHYQKSACRHRLFPNYNKGRTDPEKRRTKSKKWGDESKSPQTSPAPKQTCVGEPCNLPQGSRLIPVCRRNYGGPSFLSFPGEIRNHIYSYLFGDQVLKLDYKSKPNNKIRKSRLTTLRFGLHLLLTCRFIEKELDGFIFDRCTFSFHSDQALWKFVGMVSDRNLARIQKLNLDIALSSGWNMPEWDKVIEMVVFKKFNSLQYVSVDLRPPVNRFLRRDEATFLRLCADFTKPLKAIKKGMIRCFYVVSCLPH